MTVSSAWAVQGRVVWALMLREIHTIYGDTRLGYLWALINNCFSMAVFWGIRSMLGFHPPHGMSIAAFLVSGFALWFIINQTVSRSITAISGNRALLTFPQVTPMDVMLARVVVITATELVAATIIIMASLAFGLQAPEPNWAVLLAALSLAALFGLGLGSLLAALNVIFPLLEKLVPMALRILFFISGVFFSVSRMPPAIQKYVAWNPILQIIEMARQGLNPHYQVAEVDPVYLVLVVLILLTLGLLLERYVRTYTK